jgi:hypothetical protein
MFEAAEQQQRATWPWDACTKKSCHAVYTPIHSPTHDHIPREFYEDEEEGAYYKGHLVARDPSSAGLIGVLAKAAERPAILCRGTPPPTRPQHHVLRGRPLPKRYKHDNHNLHSPVPVPTCAPSRPASSAVMDYGPGHEESEPCQTEVSDALE